MKMQKDFMFDQYGWGLACLAIVCVLPMVSPVLCFATKQTGFLPYAMVLVAIVGIFYEFWPKSNVELNKRLKIESVILMIYATVFSLYDIILLIIRAENGFMYNWWDYSIIGCVFAPMVITLIEMAMSIKESLRRSPSTSGNRIASHGAEDI